MTAVVVSDGEASRVLSSGVRIVSCSTEGVAASPLACTPLGATTEAVSATLASPLVFNPRPTGASRPFSCEEGCSAISTSCVGSTEDVSGEAMSTESGAATGASMCIARSGRALDASGGGDVWVGVDDGDACM